MLTEEDFYEKASKYALLQDTDGKKYTYEEYKTLVSTEQTDKEGNLIYLYASNKEKEYSFIENATNKGYNVLMMDGQLDVALISMLERKFEKTRFSRVDSDIVERLIVKEEQKAQLQAEMAKHLETKDRRVLNGLGPFASLYDIKFPNIENPVLVLKSPILLKASVAAPKASRLKKLPQRPMDWPIRKPSSTRSSVAPRLIFLILQNTRTPATAPRTPP